jgi:hypothetical protein
MLNGQQKEAEDSVEKKEMGVDIHQFAIAFNLLIL